MKDIAISVIVPLYNAEKFIIKNIKCILNQTFKDFEIIIINDGSTDNSFELVKENFITEIKEEKIRLLNQNNFGAPSARNSGIKIASGKYLMFLDSDDLLKENALEILYKVAEEKDANLVVSGITIIDEEDRIIKKNAYVKSYEFLNEKRPEYYLYSEIPLGKLYKKEVIDENNIEWDNLRARQDTNFYFKFLGCCATEKIALANDDLSYYRILPNSISHVRNLNILDLVKSYNGVEKFYKNHNLEDNLKYLNIIKVITYTGNLANGIKYFSDRHYRKFISYYFMQELKKIDIKKYDYNRFTFSYLNKMIVKAKIKYMFLDLYYFFAKVKSKFRQ